MHALAANGDVLESVRATLTLSFVLLTVVSNQWLIILFSINLLVVYRESVNLIGYITRRLSADSQQL